MKSAVSRMACFAAAASAITALAAMAATRGNAASVGKSTTFEVAKAPAASMQQLKALYRRPDSIPFPKDNPYTLEKATLGKKLYFDTRLSAANVLSCASCHNPAYGWGDGLPKGVGHGMKQLGRRSPTIVNAAFGLVFMWDGRAASLEEQALGPIVADVEMNLPIDRLIARLTIISEYRPLFQAAFPREGIAPGSIGKALATYERTVVSGRAPFDAWIEGDEKAISEAAKRGFMLFNSKAACANCHSGWNFTDDSFHDIGLADSDIGRGKYLPNVIKMAHAFKTPGLREITRRGPYMHDGSIPTLEAVMDHYSHGGISRPSRSEQIKALGLSKQEKDDLVAFMKTMASNLELTTVPVLPR
jgi:cytochrome c peroxidase